MQGSEVSFISRIREARSSIPEALTLAGLLAFAIAILSAGIYEIAGPAISIFLGFTLTLTCVIYIIARKTKPQVYDAKFQTVAFLKRGDSTPLRVRNYHFSERLSSHMRSAFAEAPALKAQWGAGFTPKEKRSQFFDPDSYEPGLRLIKEAAEYELLETLATKLSDYFNQHRGETAAIREYSRANLPDVLLSNRLFEIFSRDMADREGFDSAREGDKEEIIEGNKKIVIRVIAASSRDGRYYHHFSLTLPKDSRIYRPEGHGAGALNIQGPVVDIELRVHCQGYAASIPFSFSKHYMKMSYEEVRPLQVEVSVRITVKRRFNWRMKENVGSYGWVEPLMGRLRKDFDFEFFLQRINWESIEATIWSLKEEEGGNEASPRTADT
ncbi:Hypothetical Protein PMSV [Streptomyces leeuwenhoekii]|uniref:Uncharacterized protein n=1 Tax=Streptomyces leeuwenhoekii TaxID=1437453 RepID=A0A0F7VSN8_STRLW|nr:Hypothetical Protein PMSV [Streptomyces leeuwenhoekii]